MNIASSFAEYMESTDVATIGQDLYIARAPSSNTENVDGDPIPQNIWWLVANGGFKRGKLDVYSLNIYYRDRNALCVYDKLQQLSDAITCAGCLELTGFEVVEVETTGFHSDQDIDNEERTVGLLQVEITTYKECNNGIS